MIITIVVLLILAGITIANITGGDGVIEQASHKKDETTIANEKQILENAVISASDKFGEITENNLLQALNNQNVEITKSGGLYRIVFKDTNNLYKMNKDGEFFYWENMQPTDIYAKKDGTTLYLRSTQPDTSYVKGTRWNDNTITKVIIEEPIAPKTCVTMFNGCTALQEIDNIENLHTENATSMYYMFFGCSNLKSVDLKYFDTSNVKYMTYMFYDCKNLETLDISSFDTRNVEEIGVMFYNCKNLKGLDLSNFDLTKVTSLAHMFNGCSSLTRLNLSNLNTNNIQNMRQMFYDCKNLETLDISSFDTNNVTNMNYMFGNCINLKTIYVSDKFVTSKVSNEQIPNSTSDNTNSSYLFLRDTNLVGGNGTKYSLSHTNKEYARVDDPDNGTPGYFTLKQ